MPNQTANHEVFGTRIFVWHLDTPITRLAATPRPKWAATPSVKTWCGWLRDDPCKTTNLNRFNCHSYLFASPTWTSFDKNLKMLSRFANVLLLLAFARDRLQSL